MGSPLAPGSLRELHRALPPAYKPLIHTSMIATLNLPHAAATVLSNGSGESGSLEWVQWVQWVRGGGPMGPMGPKTDVGSLAARGCLQELPDEARRDRRPSNTDVGTPTHCTLYIEWFKKHVDQHLNSMSCPQ